MKYLKCKEYHCKHLRWKPPVLGVFEPYCGQVDDGYTNDCFLINGLKIIESLTN